MQGVSALLSGGEPFPNWGLFATVLGLPSYFVFALAALVAGSILFFGGTRRAAIGTEHAAIVLVFALIGAGIGAKLPVLAVFFSNSVRVPAALLSGRTMLGGVAGGLLAAAVAKKLFLIRARFGDAAAPAVACALSIGRVGCLGAGCCYGKAAAWGIYLGDGILRWPTQLFEIVFHALAFAILLFLTGKKRGGGVLLPGYLAAYFVFRYCTEFLREGTPVWGGQTGYQLFCIGGLLFLIMWALFSAFKRHKGGFLP